MVDPIETLRKEGGIIKGAPWSFVIVNAVIIGILYGVFQWMYGAQIEHWKGLAEQNTAEPQPPFTVVGLGCTPTSTTGAGSAGTFTLAPGPCKAVTITMGSPLKATNGWHCGVGDKTALGSGSWIPQWIETASTTTTATIPIPLAAGPGDVISFACSSY